MILSQTSFFQLIAQQFYQTSWLEWVGFTTGFACVYLAAKEHISNWPVSIISVVASAIVYYESALYGDAFLQLYFLFTAIYGWYYWIKREKEHEKPVVQFNVKQMAATFAAIAVLTFLIAQFLQNYTNSSVPYIDGFCTSMSFVAQFLMTRKVLQNWLLWIVVDICYVPLLLYKELYLFALLYLLYWWLATMGYLDWRKTWKMAKA